MPNTDIFSSCIGGTRETITLLSGQLTSTKAKHFSRVGSGFNINNNKQIWARNTTTSEYQRHLTVAAGTTANSKKPRGRLILRTHGQVREEQGEWKLITMSIVLDCLGRSFFATVFLLMFVQWSSQIMSMALQWNPDKLNHSFARGKILINLRS